MGGSYLSAEDLVSLGNGQKRRECVSVFKLSQEVDVAIGQKEWVDIAINQYEKPLREYARRIKEANPKAELGLRLVEETELLL